MTAGTSVSKLIYDQLEQPGLIPAQAPGGLIRAARPPADPVASWQASPSTRCCISQPAGSSGHAKPQDPERAPEAGERTGYRAAELAIMSRNFSGPHEPYAQLRRAFVYKDKPTQTPPTSPVIQSVPACPAGGKQRLSVRGLGDRTPTVLPGRQLSAAGSSC
jgi:hypothetical protein